MTEITVASIFARSDQSGGLFACWPWTGGNAHERGYGRILANGRRYRAARVLLGLLRGRALSPDEHALHHCDNPSCVNPAHLYVGSHADNMRDLFERHPRGPVQGIYQHSCQLGHVKRLTARGYWTCPCDVERCRRNRAARRAASEALPATGGRASDFEAVRQATGVSARLAGPTAQPGA